MARRGLSPLMVGRGPELARLRRLLRAAAGDSQVALVAGEAGVGKTRLLQELLAGVPAGTPVLAGQAEQGAMGRPFELLVQAAEPLVRDWRDVPDALTDQREALCLLLRPVAPGLGGGLDRAFTPEELLRAAVELVRHLTGPGPAVVVFEDLHWADAESLTLFRRLATTPRLPVLLVGTYRPEGLDRRQVTDLLADVERQRSVEHATVSRLTADEVAELLTAVYGRPVPFPVAEALHRRTGGNPFFIEELLVAAQGAPPEQLVHLPLPVSVTEAVLRHLDGLGPEERRVVDAASVLGQRIPFDLLAAVTGIAEGELIGVLRNLVGRGLVVEEDVDVFSFRHALSREAVAGRLLGRERRRLHEKALVALQELGSDDWATLAYHAAGANRWDEVVAAARRGAAHYLHTGSTYQALRLAELGLEEADADLELLELAAMAAWSAALRQRAIDRAEQWKELAEAAGEDEQRCRALRVLARLRWEVGDLAGQRRMVDEVLAAAERLGPSAELAWAYSLMAESKMLAYESEEAIAWADQALALADRLGHAEVRPSILVNKGSAVIDLPGRTEEGAALLEQAAAEAEAQGDHLALLRALNNLGKTMYLVWPLARTRALLDRMTRVVEHSGRRDWNHGIAALRRSLLLDVEGDLVAARAGSRSEDAFPRVDQWHWEGLKQARIALEADELDQAAELLERARSRGVDDPERPLWAEELAAELAARRGDLDAAVRHLEAVLALVATSEPNWMHAGDVWFRPLHAAVRAGLDPAAARRLHRHAPPPVDAPSYDPAWPSHLEGALLEAEGEPERALAAYRDALAPRSRHRPPALSADAHQGAARCLLALGRPDQARAHAEEAVRLLGRWPGWRRRDAEALRRRLGAGPAVPGPAALTPREREVAALLAQGLSNAEVGRRLYISTKTASVHVSNILAKLGMSSRTEVAAWAAREGLGG